MILITPILIPVIIILRFTGEGKIFYKQLRIGYKNRSFYLWKFVTMREKSPNTGTITAKNDPRILPFGKFLRKTKINELLQILNVIKGDLTIVGPRPLTREAFELYPQEIKPLIYKIKPGVTGIGSVVFRNEEEILANSPKSIHKCVKEDIAPIKGALEIWYANNKSTLTNIKIILLTAILIFRPNNKLYLKLFKKLPIHDADQIALNERYQLY